jgi:hypothetical protein
VAETPEQISSSADVIDQRLLPFTVVVRAGRFVERQWEFFRTTYFPGMTAKEAAEALVQWAERAGVRATLLQSATVVGATPSNITYVRVTPRN